MAANEIPGVAVGIIQDNALVYENGFGVRNLDTSEPMTSRSVMSMASVSKAFTAAAIMQLIEAGKVSVKDTFVKHVPYFEMEDPRYKDITIRHLLAHNSGMPELTDDLFFAEWDDPWTDDGAAERYVRSFATGVMLNQDPGGDQFLYSDFGYDILADLIHKVSGELFEEYCRSHFFEPLADGGFDLSVLGSRRRRWLPRTFVTKPASRWSGTTSPMTASMRQAPVSIRMWWI